MRSVHWVFLWRAVLGVSVWRAAFVHVGSAYRHYMIGDVLAVVKGGFLRSFASHYRRSRQPPRPRRVHEHTSHHARGSRTHRLKWLTGKA